MKNNNSGIFIGLIAIIFFQSFITGNKNFSKDVPIGTIIYSIMPPEYFENEYPGWVLLKGQGLEKDTELYRMLELYPHYDINENIKFDKDTLPNTLGMFLRSSNYKYDGVDKDTLRVIGSPQSDATKLPNSPFLFDVSISNDEISRHSHRAHSQQAKKPKPVRVNHDGSGSTILYNDRTDLAEGGKHSHNIKVSKMEGGDKETRPQNVTFYTYIKIK